MDGEKVGSLRPTIFSYIAIAAMGLPFLASVISSNGPSGTPAPFSPISVFLFGYNPSLYFFHSSFTIMLTWLDYFLFVGVITIPFEIAIQTRRSRIADQNAKRLDVRNFQVDAAGDQFLLWLRPFSLDNRLSIFSLPEFPHAVYVSFSDRTRSIPIFPTEVSLYDMFRSFTTASVIHISEGGNNLPGGGGLTYGEDEWRAKVELAIRSAKTVVFQPFDTQSMHFELDLLKRLRGLDDIVFFFPVIETQYSYRRFFRTRVKTVEHLRYGFSSKDPDKEIDEISRSIMRFCEKSEIEYPKGLPFPALIRYHKGGEIDAICSLYLDRKSISNFVDGVYELEVS